MKCDFAIGCTWEVKKDFAGSHVPGVEHSIEKPCINITLRRQSISSQVCCSCERAFIDFLLSKDTRIFT